jgi:hypothetical protein
MNKQLKIEILKAIQTGSLSKSEAKEIIKSDGKIIFDLSNQGEKPFLGFPFDNLLEKFPTWKIHFETVIFLGKGIKPT